MIKDFLSSEGMQVDSCGNGMIALRILTGDARYDVVIVDNDLPGLSGLELARRVRKITHRRKIPIIMLYGDEIEAEVCERVFSRYWLFSILDMLTLGVVLPIILPRVYGQGFRPSVAPAEILLIAALFMGAKGVLGGGAAALGDPWLVSRANLLALPLCGGVTFGVVVPIRFNWRAIASAAAYFAEFGLVVFGLRRRHSISPARLFRFRIADLRSFMASAVVGLRRNRLDYSAN